MKFKIKANMKKKAAFVKIDMEDYIDALDERLAWAENQWGGAPELHDQLLDFIRDVYDGQEIPSVGVIADNFVVNGEFVYKDEFTKDGNYSGLFEKYSGNWEELCENEGVLYNDEVCCIRLGF